MLRPKGLNGVGGSIPSLATSFDKYRANKSYDRWRRTIKPAHAWAVGRGDGVGAIA